MKTVIRQCDVMQNCVEENSNELFEQTYKALCREKNVKPLSAVQRYLQKNCLRFCADYVNLRDWSPILNAITQDRSLSKISVYSRCRHKKIRTKVNADEKLVKLRRCAREDRQQPVLYTNFLLRWLVYSLAICLKNSLMITSLALDGIPLLPKYQKILTDGLASNRNLRSLSLVRCRIGDAGCDLLLESLQYNPSLRILNLSSCCLTNRSAACVSLFLKKRRAILSQNTRKELTLSRDDIHTTSEEGLQVLILNRNHKFSDVGLRQLIRILKSDFCLKTLCLRSCGITEHGGELVLELLQINRALTQIDLKENEISTDILQAIHKALKRKKSKEENILTNDKVPKHKDTEDTKISKKTFSQSTSKKNKLPKNQNLESKAHHDCTLQIWRPMYVRKTRRKISAIHRPQNTIKRNHIKWTNADELKKCLSLMIENNRNLITTLENSTDFLMKEKSRRLSAEEAYRKIQPRLKNLKNKMAVQTSIHSSMYFENQVYANLRNVFDKLGISTKEKECKTDERSIETEAVDGKTNSIAYYYKSQPYKSEIAHLSHRRPNCPK